MPKICLKLSKTLVFSLSVDQKPIKIDRIISNHKLDIKSNKNKQ